jgi:hypothetical protein
MRYIYISLLSILILALSGCRDIQVKTIINNNGTVSRTYIITQDIQYQNNHLEHFTEEEIEAEIKRQLKSRYFPMDTSWKTEFTIDTAEKKTSIKFTKAFKNIKKLQQDLIDKNYKLKPLNPKIEVIRTYNWFTTTNTYKESYDNIFTGKPYKEYFTKQEIAKIRKGTSDDNDSTQLKYYAWVAYAVVDEVITIINNECDSTVNLNAWRKLMYDKIDQNTFSDPSKENNPFILPEMDSDRDDIDFSDSEMLISSIKRYSDFNLPEEKEALVQKILKQKMDIYMSLFTDNLRFSVKMPGNIDEHNGSSIKNKTVFWKMDPFIAGTPVEMILITKQSNAGIPITIIVIVIALLSYWILRRRR